MKIRMSSARLSFSSVVDPRPRERVETIRALAEYMHVTKAHALETLVMSEFSLQGYRERIKSLLASLPLNPRLREESVRSLVGFDFEDEAAGTVLERARQGQRARDEARASLLSAPGYAQG
jgi:hypothetical protein